MPRFGTARQLANHDLCSRFAPRSIDRTWSPTDRWMARCSWPGSSNSFAPRSGRGTLQSSDNLSSHKVKGVKEAIAAVGASVLYLPPYSPDLNPIEKLLSKLKTLLRKAAKRSVDELWKEIGELLNPVSKSECANYFASSGYVST